MFPQAFNQRGRPDQPHYPRGEPQKLSLLLMPMVEFYAYLLEKKLVTPKIISVTNAHGG